MNMLGRKQEVGHIKAKCSWPSGTTGHYCATVWPSVGVKRPVNGPANHAGCHQQHQTKQNPYTSLSGPVSQSPAPGESDSGTLTLSADELCIAVPVTVLAGNGCAAR